MWNLVSINFEVASPINTQRGRPFQSAALLTDYSLTVDKRANMCHNGNMHGSARWGTAEDIKWHIDLYGIDR